MTEKRQTSQGYIIRILQHFATKLRNITNFVMLFQAVMKFLSIDLLRSVTTVSSRDRLEFYLHVNWDRLKTCRDGYVLMGGEGPINLGYRVCL